MLFHLLIFYAKPIQTSVSVSYLQKQNGENCLAIIYRCLSRQKSPDTPAAPLSLFVLPHVCIHMIPLLFLLLVMSITIPQTRSLQNRHSRLWHHKEIRIQWNYLWSVQYLIIWKQKFVACKRRKGGKNESCSFRGERFRGIWVKFKFSHCFGENHRTVGSYIIHVSNVRCTIVFCENCYVHCVFCIL